MKNVIFFIHKYKTSLSEPISQLILFISVPNEWPGQYAGQYGVMELSSSEHKTYPFHTQK